ncbi:MAG: protein translocase subunit SecD [Candidatus Omnitrophica bacterium]|nr:protein translocase subunit SecD [Candidatus Omnitrophota bacterium]
MDKFFKWKVLSIILVVAGSIWCAYPLKEKIHLGLDLQGGIQLLLQVELDKIPKEARADAADRAVEVIRNRIDAFGVVEPQITRQGTDKVVVQLPGITDRNRAREIVAKTAHLEFRLVSDDPELAKKADSGTIPEGYEYKEIKGALGLSKHLVSKEALLSGDHLTDASVGFDSYGQSIVQLQFDDQGAKKFDEITFKNTGKQLAIVLDGTIHSAPVIRDRIPNGRAQISGSFTVQEAGDLALVLRAGALPAPVTVIEERTVGPTLGRDSIEKGLRSALLGCVLVFIFMPCYYLLAGVIADIGLLVYVIMVTGSLAMLHSSLTLPGIAGFILSVGMAVDANILISERMREELEAGKTRRAAISAGYHRAFAAIFDSNMTVFITAVILFFLGTGPIKGFAVTLGLGQIASMFSSLTVTRVAFDFISKRNPDINLNMLKLIGVTNVPFLRWRFLAYIFSGLMLVFGTGAIIARGGNNFGVEFSGGTLLQMGFTKTIELSKFRAALEKEGVKEPTIQPYGNPSDNQFIVKTKENGTAKIEKAAVAVVGEKQYQILKVDQVGPTVSGDLKSKALWAVFWSSIGILFYLGFRFPWHFSCAAVVALLHDTIFTFGVYAMSGREINLASVAAILTIMGYSVNDTIVVFDRIRENLKNMRKKPFGEVVELSLNQTLGRTLLTSANVLFGAVALFVLGGPGINDFAFILCVGFAVGIYSSVFVASALAVDSKAQK